MGREQRLITNGDAKSPVVEAYKTLRTNIQFSSVDKEMKVVLVTSPSPSEGKSTTISNLAITMAQADQKVLLIDCDLRKPVIHKVFNIDNVKGITNILVEGIDYKSVLHNVGIENLSILTTGPKPPNPSELLGSARMQEFIASVRKDFDMILIDTAPAVPVTDPAVLSRLVDGVIIVVDYGTSTYEMALKAKENLERVNANILGMVINRVPVTKSYGYYYYYYYYEDSDGKRRRVKKRRYSSPAESNTQVGI